MDRVVVRRNNNASAGLHAQFGVCGNGQVVTHHAKGYDDSVLSQVRCFQATKRWRDLRVKVSGKRRLPWQALTPHSLALDTWREQLPPNLVLTGHSNRNALPHVIMLQLAWEWLVILCYRSYYRFSVRSGSRAEPEGISAVAVKVSCRSGVPS